MPNSIGLLFDGWSAGSTYYVGVYAIYVVAGSPRRVLLALAPLLDENDFGADSHIAFITETLSVFGKEPGCVRFIVRDNCSTSQAIATHMGLPLVGCASHRLNLAIPQHVEEHEGFLSQVNELTSDVSAPHQENAATLLKFTELQPAKRNATRWSSTFKMVRRFLQIKHAVKHVEAVEELVPRAHDCRKLEKLDPDLRALDSICVTLQSNKTTHADVRTLFDGVGERYPAMSNYLSKDATIVHSPTFEAAALLFHVPLTSNDCDRLFSKAKAVLTPQRSSMLPINFEMIMFLKGNSAYWSHLTVAEVQQSAPDLGTAEDN
eukprot:jgi/Phyca11/105488/e_gw1.11.548.1